MKIERIYEIEIQGHALRLSHDEAEQLFTSLDNVLNKNTINLEWLPKDTDQAKIGQPSRLYSENDARALHHRLRNAPRAGIDYIDR